MILQRQGQRHVCVENKFLLEEELAFLENHKKLDALTEADEITSYHKSF